MSRCDLHFGDPTAHATVQWFLRSLTEEGGIPPEDLCKELNVARFIDCLRQQVDEKVFESIEGIAADLKEEKWKAYPHLSVLLFSIARDFLVNQFPSKKSVKATSLYCIAEGIYEHFKQHPNSHESCSHVFMTGFQLAYFQEDNEWHREYAAFKEQHYKELSELRLHYYSVEDNPTNLPHRIVERWKRISSITKEFEALEQDFNDLNPLRLELPILTRSTEVSKFADSFVQNLKVKKADNKELAKKFRIIQWEVLVRNLVEENRKSELCFQPITVDYNIAGIPDEEFLIHFIEKAREIECRFIPSYGEIPTKQREDCLQTKESFPDSEDLTHKVRECHESFKILLSQIPERYPFVHENIVKSFINIRGSDESSNKSSNAMLIEDGEFSFFSLLWFLRYARYAAGKNWKSNLEDWKSNPDSEQGLTTGFRPSKASPSGANWSSYNITQFAEECGLIIPLSKSKCIPTRRWSSLIAWLKRLNADLRVKSETAQEHLQEFLESKTLKHDNLLIQRLPVNRLDYNKKEEISFVRNLREFLASDRLKGMLDKLNVFFSGASISCEAFAEEKLGALVESLDDHSLLEVESSAGLKDMVLLYCSRGFIPLEHLFRAYHPCELHLLLQALNWEESFLEDWNQAPTSLGFATIVGRVELSQDLTNDSDISHFDHWLETYRSLFSTLSADITVHFTKVPAHEVTKCDRHFDDWTAHATVQWFLSQLPRVNSFTKDEPTIFDNFCKDLNNVHFIDCLRHQVEENEHIFEDIKRIAKKLEGTEKWREFPNLSVLLLGISRESLKNSDNQPVKEALLTVVKKIYDDFTGKSNSCNSNSKCDLCKGRSQNVKPPDFCESRYLVFRAGCQLLHFQDDKWKSEFAKFRRLHSEEISKFRMLYYWTDNAAVFTRRVFERWQRDNPSIAKEFKHLEKDHDRNPLDDLNPLRFELPIQARSAEAFKFASRFVEDFEDNKKIGEDVKNLAKEFRIVQWEVLVRNLVEETIKDRYCFHPMSVENKIPGMPDEDFLKNFINNTREVECRFEPSYGEIPTKQRDYKDSLSREKTILDDNKVKEVTKCSESFKMLLDEMPNRYFFVHKDLVDSFANIRALEKSSRVSDEPSNKPANAMLIEDGELSFFSLLWFLRYARYAAEENGESNLEDWKSNPGEELTILFRLEKENPSEPFKDSWSKCDMYDFAEECGLIIRLSESECVPTHRWRSLIAWLRRLNDDLSVISETDRKDLQELRESKTLKYDNFLIRRLRIKILDYDTDRTAFIRKLWRFLRSDALEEKLNELDKPLSDASTSDKIFAEKFYERFAKELGGLIELLDNHSLLKAESSVGLEDMVLLRCCRGFIPIEHLIRAYKPCELHLLFQALNWEESHLGDRRPAPISIGCATIAGQVEAEDALRSTTNDSESSQTSAFNFDNWLVPYRSLFFNLSADFSLSEVKEASERIGEQGQQSDFAHQTAGLLDTLWLDPKRTELRAESQVALWLAKTQVTEVWGGFPLDTQTHICVDFPEWEGLKEIDIIDKLIDLGLHAGIIRASKSEIEDVQERAWDLGANLRGDDPEIVKQTFCEVRSLLSFCLPKDPPPKYVTTKAFAICFFHGLRQAAYHALEMRIDSGQEGKRYLGINWVGQSVSIYNQGKVEKEHRSRDFLDKKVKDRGFFYRFVEKTDEFCREHGIAEKFTINGPEPVNASDDTWQLVITKE